MRVITWVYDALSFVYDNSVLIKKIEETRDDFKGNMINCFAT